MNNPRGGVVVGYDGSPGATVALEWATEEARRYGEPLLVLHAAEPAAVAIAPSPLPTVPQSAGPAQSTLDAGVAIARARLGRGQATGRVVRTSPAAALVDASAGARLVVTGCRGRSRLAAGLLGSVSYAVTAHARCPAVVVRGQDPAHPDPAHRVVVGVDGSPTSERAVEHAAAVAADAGALLHVVGIGTITSPESWAYVETSAAGNEHTHAAVSELEPAVEQAAKRARAAHTGLLVETEVLFGPPGRVLAQLGEHAGLLVVGSRGRGGFTGLLLGSVSHRLVHEASGPVMVVHADD